LSIIVYLMAIVTANIVTVVFSPLHIFGFIVTWGTWFIGATFILRDLVQQRYGRVVAYKTIAGAVALSIILSIWQGGLLYITIASALSFFVSETADTEIFTRISSSFTNRVLLSGLVGGLLDSVIFVLVGLSPIGANILPWGAVTMAVLGQWIVKSLLQGIGVLMINLSLRVR